ncbi:anti-sigma factor RsbA family regulatory protein [Aquihabitans sp. McL0605]|uniref:anti-sigma factor RsbA family regulatory protein n=1 Tax=Aquihabitans sp. McL0605 TaxID=3415671 RepID=UPI003CFBA04D
MTAATGVAPHGFCHSAVLYDTDEELLAVAVPFLTDGARAGQPTILALDEERTALITAALGPTEGIEVVPAAGRPDRPALAIQSFLTRFEQLVAEGATQIRVLGNIPVPEPPGAWQPWARYEAYSNQAFASFPLWGMCVFDTRTSPAHVLDDARRTHTHLATPHAHAENDRFEDPAAFLEAHMDFEDDPLQAHRPVADLIDPRPAQARHAVDHAAAGGRVEGERLDGLIIAVSEVVTNAVVHGRPPVEVRAWTEPDRIVVTVADGGTGPVDPTVGLAPVPRLPGEGGLGLWIANQLCDEVALRKRDDGFTIRLTARAR